MTLDSRQAGTASWVLFGLCSHYQRETRAVSCLIQYLRVCLKEWDDKNNLLPSVFKHFPFNHVSSQ